MSIRFDDDPDVAIGITLPLTNGKNGYFDQSYTTIVAAKTNLKKNGLIEKSHKVGSKQYWRIPSHLVASKV